jgi:TolB-like protein/Tfp pilus assembly protein PilF
MFSPLEFAGVCVQAMSKISTVFSVRPEDTVPPEEALRALKRVLDSEIFVHSNRLSQFLRFAVEQTLNGHEESLKEYTIGTQAYGRKPDFDPSQDTIIRTEARRLRRKLKEYYEGEGKSDEVVIFIRSGSYVPVIRWRASLEGQATSPDLVSSELWIEGDGVRVAVTTFQAHSEDPIASAFAFGISDEIVHKLIKVPGVRVVSDASIRPHSQRPYPLSKSDEHSAQIIIEGTVRSEQNRLRVTARVATSAGLLLWSQRFDASTEHEELVKLQEAVASALLNRVSPRESTVRAYVATPTQTLYQLYSEVLSADALLEEGSIPDITEALKRFEELAIRVPEYARLHCGIAQCCVALAQRGVAPSRQLIARADEACRRAMKMDTEVVDVHSTMGCILAQEWKWKAAEESFRAALRLGDQHSAHRDFSQFLLIHSRFDEAWTHLQIAEGLDTFSARQKTCAARFLYYSRWHRETREYYLHATQYGPQPIEAKIIRAFTEIQMGEVKFAITFAESLRRQVGTLPVYLGAIAEIFALCGKEGEARSLTADAALLTEESPISYFRKASLALSLKERAKSLEFLGKSLQQREAELPWIAADPRFDSIRIEDAYQSIIRAVL